MKDFAAGSSLGALIGMLIGLSANEVVGSVVAGLVALLAAFFGLQSGTSRLPATTPGRITSFSIAALVALLAGLYMRTNDTLAPDVIQRAEAWEEVGFEQDVAARLAAFERLGTVPGSWLPSDAAIEASTRRSTVLFDSVGTKSCDRLDGRPYGDAQAIAEAMAVEGGAWKKLADSLPTDMPEVTREGILRFAISLLCEANQ